MLAFRHLHLRVRNLGVSVDFYTRRLGFTIIAQDPRRADLAVVAGTASLLTLTEDASAPPAPRDAAGLFHAALLFPSRSALGHWLRSASEAGVEFEGFSDHGVSEAIYFSDPDGNGLEFYVDRPREQWPFAASGEVAMTTDPLDVESLLHAGLSANDPAMAGARWGHLHLRVTDLDRSEKFYRDTLGVTLTQGSYPGARFLAADGYHHHLGLNTWGHPRSPRPPGALGLVEATFARAGVADSQTFQDPDGIALKIVEA